LLGSFSPISEFLVGCILVAGLAAGTLPYPTWFEVFLGAWTGGLALSGATKTPLSFFPFTLWIGFIYDLEVLAVLNLLPDSCFEIAVGC